MLMQTNEARLTALRQELKRRELDGFLIPIADEHMSEYVGAYAQRLAWLTGFRGSAGSAAVLTDKAAIFVDGRYTVQVREQVEENLFEYCSIPADTIGGWLGANVTAGARIGYDPWLHSRGWVRGVQSALTKMGAELVPTLGNPIDAVWQDQPEASAAKALPHIDALAGKSSAEKRAEIADGLKASGHDAAIISALDSVAWLLNIRGCDVDNTPVALSYVIAHADSTAELFIAPEKVTAGLTQHLGNAVTIRDRADFESALSEYSGKSVSMDPGFGVDAIAGALEAGGATVSFERDPCILPKAVKNATEQQGHRDAQARDGAAVARFLHWLEETAPSGEVDELSAAAKLRSFREANSDLRDLSFRTISGASHHAALPHYSVDEDSNIPIPPASIYLVDSGGQYPAGTTDITRTVWIGTPDGSAKPSEEMRDRYTRVLKGHIALALAVFPSGTAGCQLDTFARQHLWSAGVDYAHGTGHGVGSFLSVHEGPQRIAKSAGGQAGTDQELMAGMILSNEPGYYKTGEAGAKGKDAGFGIRIENLVLVEPRAIAGAEGAYFGFETLTFVPIDRKLVDKSLLSPQEIAWWNDYHADVEALLAPQLDGPVLEWVKRECKPL